LAAQLAMLETDKPAAGAKKKKKGKKLTAEDRAAKAAKAADDRAQKAAEEAELRKLRDRESKLEKERLRIHEELAAKERAKQDAEDLKAE